MTTIPPPVPVTANLTPSKPLLSSFVISTAVERLFGYVNGTVTVDNDTEFGKYCSSLSRGIDFSIDINEIPQRAQELPNLMKQLCRWTNDMSFRAAIMVLMISIKGACKAGWFSEKDNEELHSLSIEIANNFSSVKDMISGEGTFHQTVSSVISRFYPGMKMGEVLAFIEATPGYGAYVKDFYMTANAKASNEKVYLFVARTDTTETSSCIVSPQQVNIFLNGNPVDRRTYVYKDPGPQLPTLVTNINKSGSNLLQALGQFNGKFVILVAFMSMGSNPRCPELPDYVAPAAATSDSDNDIIEGPSRVSLICPISFKRIITPVKGHLCKHLQCFDFDNYVDINSRRPSWRCPHCGQSVCFTDIRIDQGMVKVLKEVGENVSHVKVSGDGSWLTFDECDDHVNKPQDKPPVPQESPTSLNVDPNIIILAEGDNDMDRNPDQVDKKPTPAQLQAVSMNNVRSSIAPPMMAPVTGTGNATSQGQSQNQSQRSASIDTKIPTHAILTSSTAMNTLLHGQNQSQVSASNTLQLPAHAIGTSNTIMNAMSHGQSQIQRQSQMSASNNMQLPTHSVFNAVMDAVSQGSSQTYVSNDMQFQQHNLNTMRNDHCGRYPTSARHISIIPTASTGTVIDDRQQQFYNYHIVQHQTMRMMSSPPS